MVVRVLVVNPAVPIVVTPVAGPIARAIAPVARRAGRRVTIVAGGAVRLAWATDGNNRRAGWDAPGTITCIHTGVIGGVCERRGSKDQAGRKQAKSRN